MDRQLNQRLWTNEVHCSQTPHYLPWASATKLPQDKTPLRQIPIQWNPATTQDVVYSKTSLTRTSGDRPKTSVLTEVRVIRKLKKIKAKIALLPYRVYRLFRQTASRHNCCLFLPASVSLIITIFWSKSNTVYLHLLLILTSTIQLDAPAACNISIPSPAVVFTARVTTTTPAGTNHLLGLHVVNLVDRLSRCSSQRASTYHGCLMASTLYVM